LWGSDRAGHYRAAPSLLYDDLRTGRNIAFSTDVLAFLRDSRPPLRMFYAPRKVLTGIALASNHYIVYFGDVPLSTDFNYHQQFAPDGKDLIFDIAPTDESVQKFLQLVSDFQVTDILVTPDYQDAFDPWQSALNSRGPLLSRIYDRDGYSIYSVNAARARA
jgi:hypothetical protein